jgi:thiol:disulfide interchange protein DsbD
MMIRVLLLLLIGASFAARASEPIAAPTVGKSATVTQPHVTAELIPDYAAINGSHFDAALHLHADPGWHTYWINPGDAGLATSIKWTLPPGFSAGPIQWPTPEKHNMGPLVTYGYASDVYLLTTITPPAERLKWPLDVEIKANAQWLVCKEECIPGHADLSFRLEGGMPKPARAEDDLRAKFFAEARARLPVPNTLWKVTGTYEPHALALSFHEIISAGIFGQNVYFFPEQSNVLSATESSNPNGLSNDFIWTLPLQQNGDKPDHISGVLVSDSLLTGANAKSVYISEFPVTSGVAGAGPRAGAVSPSGGPDNSLSGSSRESGATGGNQQASATENPAAQRAAATSANQPLLIAVLGFAFIGGLILNLMPCVLPVLSLKVFSLMKHAGENPRVAWIQGVAFTAGVVLSFWVLAGLLLALRAAGNQLGWGFQMQSPGFVLALIFLFFLLGLNLFGVFEFGASLVGLDAKATSHLGGMASSFGNGALATVAATPCTAPFMGSALGFAAQQPPLISLLIFTFLALGMATPYLLLTIFPGALRFVPKPGAWMEAFKQFMGFLLMATVIFLVYVFGALTEENQVPWLLLDLLLVALAAWIYGSWATPMRRPVIRAAAMILAFGWLVFAICWGVMLAKAAPAHGPAPATDGWQPWTQAAVDDALAKGQPVFVDFTAAWCANCKVNEAFALGSDSVKKAFAERNVALFRADWSRANADISNALRRYNRDGVPLYLLYSPKHRDAPQVLPDGLITPGDVLDALKNL